jgi:hypothetical protein
MGGLFYMESNNMKRAAVLVSALAVVLYTVGMSAQAKPSFAGKWTMDAPAAPPAGGGGGGRGGRGGGGGAVTGMTVTITQDAANLTVEGEQAGRGGAAATPFKRVYKLDGTDSKNAGRGGTEVTSKAVWEGNKLTISTTQTMGDAPVTTKQSISMDGAKLKVENFGPDGAATTTLTYTKGS